MLKINIMLYRPAIARFNILMSYHEVMESLRWGFVELGYNCTLHENIIDGSALNIVFGWQVMMQTGQFNLIPKGSILYNLEQFYNRPVEELDALRVMMQDFVIWDYSEANIRWWHGLGIHTVYHAIISYAPSLARLPDLPQDIDLLFYGSLGPERFKALQTMVPPYRSVVTLGNVWGQTRDELIARSKIILNLQENNPQKPIFEVVRVSYLLNNKKAVLCQIPESFDLQVEDDIRQTLVFETPENISIIAENFLSSTSKLTQYIQHCYEMFYQRDVRNVIRNFF
jgi:hypothetical protein